MKSKIREAFESVSSGFSPDRVVADPELNQLFLERCRASGLSADASTLNRTLINMRKAGDLTGLQSRRTSFGDLDEYRFATEIAVRVLERRDGVTLDDVICDPSLANDFDQVAAMLAPGFTLLQYRWAALSLRKNKRLQPEILARVARPTTVAILPISEIVLAKLPTEAGLYLFHIGSETLYVGETENIRKRIAKHLDHSDNRELARWLWQQGTGEVALEIQTLAATVSTKIRRALELELIRSRNPTFNVRR
jgi:predicted GIY-YIG superfamily endonuclease